MSTKVERDRTAGPATPAREPLPHVCRLLRTKTAYGTSEHGAEWKRGDSPTAVYWCLDTMETAGPDDRLAHPHGCCHGRSCFKPELD